MFWVTRSDVRVDRIACPWLIKRFIDPKAQFLFVPAETVLSLAERVGGHSFDAPGAAYGHRDGLCTFEVLIQDYHLSGDPALERLARIVHAADISGEIGTAPEGAGLLAFADGLRLIVADDHRRMESAMPLYDALYAYCGRGLGTDSAG